MNTAQTTESNDPPTPGYSPRVVVKFRDGTELPYDDNVEEHLDKLKVGPWRELRERFPGISMRRMFISVKPDRIRQLVDEAVRRDDTYRPPNFLTYFVVDYPAGINVENLVKALLLWRSVQTAYFDPPGDDPAVNDSDDPRSRDQGYLDAAPTGIDARFAWGVAGGDGAGQDVIDLERGWTLGHEDLTAHGASLLHGVLLDTSRPHGTSVLGEVCAEDNTVGCVGIAPNVGSVNVVSYNGSTRPDAIFAAISSLPYGGVLLLEAQLDATIGGTSWSNLPIEALDAEFDAIRLTTALGITVVEAAGNGSNDLDTFMDAGGNLVLNRGDAAFRDSGAIMVGAASSTAPHTRLNFSNFGSRIDCYAWGENVDTCTSTTTMPFSTTDYTGAFNGTSSASPIITGAALLVQGIAEQNLGSRFNAFRMRELLSDPATGTASNNPATDRIGVMPDLRAIITTILPRLVLVIADAGNFGNICVGSFEDEVLTLSNSGAETLTVTNITSSSGEFLVPDVLSYPLTIEAGNFLQVPIRFQPTSFGSKSATITVISNDPSGPKTVDVSGTAREPRLAVVIADAGSFGNACIGSFVDEMMSLSNSGHCTLTITGITSSSAEFLVPNVLSYPLSVEAGGSLQVPIRFQPTSFGVKAANITIVSNDPASPRIVAVSGTAPAPELDLIIANTGNFGNVCIGSFVDKPLTLLNSGPCTLTVTNVASSASEFVVPNVLAYPIRIAAGTAVEVPIRFESASFGAKSGTITVTSDDPTGAKGVAVSGNVPSGKLAVTGSTCIGGVKACCLGERTISICNVGNCKLHVTSVAFKRKSKHWKLINNPFPATLHPGSCLSVLIRYKATEKCPRCCELVITSDDPNTPEKILDVMAYTIWSDCGCKKCCDDCGKGSCEKRHDECCSAQSLDACCDDEGDGHEDVGES